jgi:hypothetical protein
MTPVLSPHRGPLPCIASSQPMWIDTRPGVLVQPCECRKWPLFSFVKQRGWLGLVLLLHSRCSFAERASAGVTCRDRASAAGTRSRTGDVGERCVSRVYLMELPRRLGMEWRATREPQWHEMVTAAAWLGRRGAFTRGAQVPRREKARDTGTWPSWNVRMTV